MRVLGISAFYHDSAAALVVDGDIVAAAQEERFTRIKHDASFPTNAIRYCLAAGGTGLGDLDHVAFYDKPFLKFERIIETYLSVAPAGFSSFRKSLPLWIKEKLFQRTLIVKGLKAIDSAATVKDKLLFSEHHQAHAASAYYPSPFEDAAILTMDGVGEWTTTSTSFGSGADLTIQKEIHFPHSLGLLYSSFTYHTGFKVNSGEYKVMGLAPYGEPRYANLILDNLIDLKEDGSFNLNMSFFNYPSGLTMTNEKFDALFGRRPRSESEPLEDIHMDMAASIQAVTEEAVLRLTRSLAVESGSKNLCLAGGVALNCVANGKVQREGAFDRIWIQPAAGDAGGAVGAALAAYHGHAGAARKVADQRDAMRGSYLGPEFDQEEIERALTKADARFSVLSDDDLIKRAAQSLAEGNALGWFQGRMEFGPRALGARSILADPRSPEVQTDLNLKVKFRESFRPFAPAVLAEKASDWFDLDSESPYMLLVSEVAQSKRVLDADGSGAAGLAKLGVHRSEIPAVTHVDYSARVQTVHKQTNPKFHNLLSAFDSFTGCPVLVNTSFNVRGEPIVGTPTDAFRCFMGTGIEALAIGRCWLEKSEQDMSLALNYKNAFELD